METETIIEELSKNPELLKQLIEDIIINNLTIHEKTGDGNPDLPETYVELKWNNDGFSNTYDDKN